MNKPRLIADIGGTNARFALLHGSEIGESEVLQVDDYETPADAIAAFLGGIPEGERPGEAAMARVMLWYRPKMSGIWIKDGRQEDKGL